MGFGHRLAKTRRTDWTLAAPLRAWGSPTRALRLGYLLDRLFQITQIIAECVLDLSTNGPFQR